MFSNFHKIFVLALVVFLLKLGRSDALTVLCTDGMAMGSLTVRIHVPLF